MQIVDEFILEVVDGIEGMQIEQFRFEQAEEILHNSIVQTVALTTHALADVVAGQKPLVVLVLILPALIGVQDRFCPRGQNLSCTPIRAGSISTSTTSGFWPATTSARA